jgi:uncharacterized protein YigE (DUF2233 family)
MLKARMIAFLLAAAISLAAHNNGALAETRPCHSMQYERNGYTVCEVDLRKHMVRLYWKRSDGRTAQRGEVVEQLGHGIVRAVCGDQLVARKRGPPVALDEWMR